MKKMFLFLALMLAFIPVTKAVEVTRDWTLLLSAGDTGIVIPEDGEIKILFSSGQPIAENYIGLHLSKSDEDFIMFDAAPADVWARTYAAEPVNVTVNLSTDVSKDD